jgi:two-component system LytT family sensor kinase
LKTTLSAGHRVRWILLHMTGAAFFSVAHCAFVSWLQAGEISVQTGDILTFSYLFERLMISYTIMNFMKYWIVVLGHLGWQYYQRYRQREREASGLATALVEARLQALRMQINPHFLFNTLNTISALVHQSPPEADRMIVRLGELLRRTLDLKDAQEVPLSEEVDFLKLYLEIEQMRFQERLTVRFNIEPKTLSLLVPHLLLQPLVENAIRHGIEPRERPGRVEVSSRVSDGDTLELRVRDDGNGFVETAAGNRREGVGLANVRSRLTHLYGAAHRFEVRPLAEGGVEAIVRIPCCVMPRDKGPRVLVLAGDDAGPESVLAGASSKQCC